MIITTKEELINSIKELKQEDILKKSEDKYTAKMRSWLISNSWIVSETDANYTTGYCLQDYIRNGKLVIRLTKNNGQYFYASRNLEQKVVDELLSLNDCKAIEISKEVKIRFNSNLHDISLFIDYNYLKGFIPVLKYEVLKKCIKSDIFEIHDFELYRKYFDCVIIDNKIHYWGIMSTISSIKNFMNKGILLEIFYDEMKSNIDNIFYFEGNKHEVEKVYKRFKRKTTIENLMSSYQKTSLSEDITQSQIFDIAS